VLIKSNRKPIVLFLFFLSCTQSICSIRNPFSYSDACITHPFCQCVALGRIGTCHLALVSINNKLYKITQDDTIADFRIVKFLEKGLVLKNTAGKEVVLLLEQKALQLK
jgi:hypothetical protein